MIHHPSCIAEKNGWYHTGDCVSGCGPYPILPPSGYPKRQEVIDTDQTAR